MQQTDHIAVIVAIGQLFHGLAKLLNALHLWVPCICGS